MHSAYLFTSPWDCLCRSVSDQRNHLISPQIIVTTVSVIVPGSGQRCYLPWLARRVSLLQFIRHIMCSTGYIVRVHSGIHTWSIFFIINMAISLPINSCSYYKGFNELEYSWNCFLFAKRCRYSSWLVNNLFSTAQTLMAQLYQPFLTSNLYVIWLKICICHWGVHFCKASSF